MWTSSRSHECLELGEDPPDQQGISDRQFTDAPAVRSFMGG